MLEKDKKKIVKSELIAMMENGMTRPEIAEHYGIPATQLKKALAQLGLTGARAKACMFVVEDDTVAANQTAIPFNNGALAQIRTVADADRAVADRETAEAVEAICADISTPQQDASGSVMAEDSLF